MIRPIRHHLFALSIVAVTLAMPDTLCAQIFDPPDQANPGDRMIQGYLASLAQGMEEQAQRDLESASAWESRRDQFRQEYLYMLGLWPVPERTPLQAQTTGTVAGNGFSVEMIHFQSRPGLYVTGNLYRPAQVAAGSRLPAVLYVCGHSPQGRNGNKTSFRGHGIWFAQHGYVCLVVDSLQLGEIAAVHHGTYREERWWWHARGYTPAGVECWNGIRAIDYLVSRADVDPQRMAVTGISGGGAATFWIAAADERVGVAVPVSGMADLTSYIPNRVINGHCDCMFFYNTFQWPWKRIAELIAPRPLLFVNSHEDPIFPMDANERITNHLERMYALFEAGDRFDTLVSLGGHDYRADIRRGVYRFINTHLRGDSRPVTDDQIAGTDGPDSAHRLLTPEQLRVFTRDDDIPADECNTKIDETFVPLAPITLPTPKTHAAWRDALLAELRRVVWRPLPQPIPAAHVVSETDDGRFSLQTETGITVPLRRLVAEQVPTRTLLWVQSAASAKSTNRDAAEIDTWARSMRREGDTLYVLELRGSGPTRWTTKNPPNFVERSHALLGRTVDLGRVQDIAATSRFLQERHGAHVPIAVMGDRADSILAAYAALVEPAIGEVIVRRPASSHMQSGAPQLLNVLRVLDIPQALGLVAPRRLTLTDAEPALQQTVHSIFAAAGASDQLSVR